MVKQLGVTEPTFYRRRKEYGGMRIDQARRRKELEAENARLKRAAADLTVVKQILKEVIEGKYRARRGAETPLEYVAQLENGV